MLAPEGCKLPKIFARHTIKFSKTIKRHLGGIGPLLISLTVVATAFSPQPGSIAGAPTTNPAKATLSQSNEKASETKPFAASYTGGRVISMTTTALDLSALPMSAYGDRPSGDTPAKR